jgi:hypothetical protein
MKKAPSIIALPDLPDHGAEATAMVETMIAIIRARA